MLSEVTQVRSPGITSATSASVSARVATRKLPTGTIRRRKNGSAAGVVAPLATSTSRAVTDPPAVSTRQPSPSRRTPVTAARSRTTAPRRTAASARPTTKRPMCIIALFGDSIAPWKASEPTSPFSSSRESIRTSGSAAARIASQFAARPATCDGFEASLSLPERRKSQGMPSSATIRSIVSMPSSKARYIATARSRPNSAAAPANECASPLLRCPPFRPEAPKPTVSASSTRTLRPAMASRRAAPSPVKPAPMTTTSKRPATGPAAAPRNAGMLSCQ